jgi:hypothetical protein
MVGAMNRLPDGDDLAVLRAENGSLAIAGRFPH